MRGCGKISVEWTHLEATLGFIGDLESMEIEGTWVIPWLGKGLKENDDCRHIKRSEVFIRGILTWRKFTNLLCFSTS